MRARDTAASWGWVTRVLHWGIAGLILFQIGLGIGMTREGVDLLTRFDLTQTHKSWGAVIFVLVLLRIGWRLAARARPGLPAGMPRWQRRAARASHAVLYVLMVLVPVSGWVHAAAAPEQDLLGIENMVFGVVVLPDPWRPGVAWISEAAAAVHGAGAWTLLALIALHAGAVLAHGLRRGDPVLARMTWGR